MQVERTPEGWCIMMRVLGMLKRLPFVPAACTGCTEWLKIFAHATQRSLTCMLHRLTSSNVAVLAHNPIAMVEMSGFTASIASRMAVMEYACPPAAAA